MLEITLKVLEVMITVRCVLWVLLCAEGCALKVMRCVLLCMQDAVEGFVLFAGGNGSDALCNCNALYVDL